MSCKYCEGIKERFELSNENDPCVTELHFEKDGFKSGFDIPIHFCPNCGEELTWSKE